MSSVCLRRTTKAQANKNFKKGTPEEWRRQMYIATSKNRVLRPESYRDEWDDDDLVLQAQQDFANYLT